MRFSQSILIAACSRAICPFRGTTEEQLAERKKISVHPESKQLSLEGQSNSYQVLPNDCSAVEVGQNCLCKTSLETYEVVDGHFEYYAVARAREKEPRQGKMIVAFIIEPEDEPEI